ncbi:MAG TPA: type II toxin-antitoxin system VapC family toxin [Candidatus Thermoplasmatota archaeon]|nr:type II toxin-antitoxin system VapC family toxin [Candidatus Thermoplasmatota archaeon]
MVETFVLDASVGVALVTASEVTHTAATERYAALLSGGASFLTTPFYTFEVGNALTRAKPKDLVRERFDEARALAVPAELTQPTLHRALAIAIEGKLSFYDAAYVALAEETGSTLWTEDKEILKRFPRHSASTAELTRKRG